MTRIPAGVLGDECYTKAELGHCGMTCPAYIDHEIYDRIMGIDPDVNSETETVDTVED